MIILKIDGRNQGKGVIIHESIDDALGDIKTYLNDGAKITVENLEWVTKTQPKFGQWVSDPSVGTY